MYSKVMDFVDRSIYSFSGWEIFQYSWPIFGKFVEAFLLKVHDIAG
jgi:hypothetical protein